MRIYDYTCESCGFKELDVLVKTQDEVVLCKLCNNKMKQEFPLVQFEIAPSKSKLTGYKPGKGNVNFGRI